MTARIEAPPARLVNAFDGKKAPEKYFQALSEADNLVREVDGLRELQTRVQELEADNAAWKYLVDSFRIERNALAAERDDLAERLRDLDEAHQITLAALARYRRRDGRATEDYHGKAVTS